MDTKNIDEESNFQNGTKTNQQPNQQPKDSFDTPMFSSADEPLAPVDEFSLGDIPQELDYLEQIPPEEIFDEEIAPKNKKVDVEQFIESDMSARKLWGVLIIKLREKNFVTLHTACGEIREVRRDGDKITAVVYEDYLFNILTSTDNFDKILFELKQIDDKITLEFVLKHTREGKIKDNLKALKNLFGDGLTAN